jgi:hypothetical protein
MMSSAGTFTQCVTRTGQGCGFGGFRMHRILRRIAGRSYAPGVVRAHRRRCANDIMRL